ncbi:hypothetical protein NSK_008610 [Nannochloropsis salina CCMP1776]|uniref:Uncharacterized protein n=1 Tax=Nannochloropsis salina CCMP1776 TaxID=1027361 RepID=A0A4D9CLS3_9STRA|nr:hypothetical protein NSK_008610 [Nannochloropsis salina CCMP1776]|eukprot:TFJ80052.1 hypothetical protein NSK_008610 [Nannochloropsis salina CCMP1776]
MLERLLIGAAAHARASSSRQSGIKPDVLPSVTITPADIQSYVLAAPELHFLGERLRESQTSGYLEGYRTRTLNSSKVPSKGRVRGLKALIDDGHARVVGADDKDDFDEDDVVASMVVAGTAEDETAGKSAQSEARGEYAVGGHAHMLDLDEDYGEEG